jgi:hypothetical protein
MEAFPGCGAAQKRIYAREQAIAGAPLIRDRKKRCVCGDPWVCSASLPCCAAPGKRFESTSLEILHGTFVLLRRGVATDAFSPLAGLAGRKSACGKGFSFVMAGLVPAILCLTSAI